MSPWSLGHGRKHTSEKPILKNYKQEGPYWICQVEVPRRENLWNKTERGVRHHNRKYIFRSETSNKYAENLADITFKIFWIVNQFLTIDRARITFLGLGSDLKIIIFVTLEPEPESVFNSGSGSGSREAIEYGFLRLRLRLHTTDVNHTYYTV